MIDDIIKWLTDDNQNDLFEFLVALVLNLLFLALSALLLWPLDRLAFVASLAKGYGLLWGAIFVSAGLLNPIQRFFRMNMYEHVNAFVLSTLAVSCVLQTAWSAFVVLSLHNLVTGSPIWSGVILYFVGFLSCFFAFWAVSSIYQGQIYKLISLPLALVSFLVFSVWPASGHLIYGWFFQLF